MYNFHFGFAEAPFSIAPDPRYLYLSEQHREALAHLLYGVGDHGGFVVLTGEVGTGKTTVCRCLLQQLPAHIDVAFIVNPKQTSLELLQTICDELAVAVPEGERSGKQLIDALNTYLLATHSRGRNAILIIDEAQNLSADVLEQLRLLTNLETNDRKLLQLILLGQPELNTVLAQPSLRQLAQRITARYHLRPLSREEAARYIEHRLAIAGCRGALFSAAAVARIYRFSQGIPRLINLLCDRSLLGVYSRHGNLVDTAMVSRAAAEVLPPRLHRWRGMHWPFAAAVTSVVIIVVLSLYATLAPRPVSVPATLGWSDVLERSASDETGALRQLYKLWGQANSPAIHCDDVPDPGLRCLHLDDATLALLQRYDKPVVLRLQSTPTAAPQYVVLKSLQGNNAQIHFGERDWTVPWRELALRWRGQALLLVAAPIEQLPLKPGATGALVAWLDEHLYRHFHQNAPRWQRQAFDHSADLTDGASKQAWLTSHYLALQQQPASSVYDEQLLSQVKRFAKEQGMSDLDGTVDLPMLLSISSLLDSDQPRLQGASVQRGS